LKPRTTADNIPPPVASAGDQDRTLPGMRVAVEAGAPLLAVALVAVVYWPLTHVYFFADDFVCLFNIVNKGFLRFVTQPFGGHLLFVRNTVFYLSHALFGFDPRPYHRVILLTHLLNVWLFFRLARRLTGSALGACLGAVLWGTSPLCPGTLGWYSVYGQVLVATILLFVVERVASLAEGEGWVPTRVALGWYTLMLAAATSFGTGIGVALVFPLVVVLLLPSVLRQRGVCLGLGSLVVAVPLGYYGFQRIYYHFTGPPPMSEAVIAGVALSSYPPILAMFWHLTAVAETGVVQGFFFVPGDYPGTASHIVVPLFFVSLVATLLFAGAATRRRIAAMIALTVGIYALIAMGRSNLYVLFKLAPHESARLARYHYVGIIPVTLLLCIMLAAAAQGGRWRSRLPAAVLVGWLSVMGWAFLRWPPNIDARPAIRRWVDLSLHQIATKIQTQPPGNDVYLENAEAPGYVLGPVLHEVEFPGLAGLFVLAYPSNVVDERRVHFIERHPVVLDMSRDPASNHRLAGLLVDPDAVATARP
jgi:hypothetical protein